MRLSSLAQLSKPCLAPSANSHSIDYRDSWLPPPAARALLGTTKVELELDLLSMMS